MQHPGHSIRLRGSACTHTGRVRDNNEDNVHLWTQSDHILVATVADGMGGAVAGEEASRIAVEAIRIGLVSVNEDHPDAYETLDDEEIIIQLKNAIRSGNSDIIHRATKNPELKGMGTTLTMAFMRGTQAIIGHVGDSRAYLVDGSDGHILQITADHSFVQALVAAGHINETEAEDHPMKNVLYRALGQTHDVEVDIYYERLRPEDRLILCTDGLTLHVRPQEIADIVMEYSDPDEATQVMVDLANRRGGRDNVSVIVIKAEAVDVGQDSELNHKQNNYYSVGNKLSTSELEEETQTVPISPGFGPSESDSAPPLTGRDGRSDRQQRSANRRRAGTEDSSPYPDSMDEEDPPSDRSNTMGEGHDLYSRDQ